MSRAIYPHELTDPDFAWLLTSFRENNPGYILIESSNMPVVLIKEFETPLCAALPMLPPAKEPHSEELGSDE